MFFGRYAFINFFLNFLGYNNKNKEMSYNQSLSNDVSARNNLIIIEISEPQNHGVGSKRYTDYLVKTKVNYEF